MADDALVVFTPSGRRGRARLGTTVLDAARALGVDIDSVCGTRGICGRCQVVQSVGDFSKHGITSAEGNLSPFGAKEAAYRDRKGLADGRRLSCTAEICGDLVIDVPAESQVHRQVVRKSLDLRRFRVDPVVRLHYVEVTQPDLASPTGDLARLLEALEREWGLRDLAVDLPVLRELQHTLRAGSWGVTVAVHDGRDVIAAWPGLHEAVFGIAIDVGSTTIAGHLANLGSGEVLASAGLMNPQIRFGEDLMSRVSYAMLNDDGAAEMTRAVRAALDELIARLVDGAGVPRDDVLELTLVGNPIMHHLFLGIDPVELGSAPFALATDRPVRTTAAGLELTSLRPGARAYVLPCIAGHVGADTAGVILADEPHKAVPIRLLVDVGTNAEIVLGNRDRLLAASSPTGPAFEGAQISSGQRAAPGAIERVRIDPVSLEPRFRVIGSDRWSDEAGFEDAIAGMRRDRDLRVRDHRGDRRAVPGRGRHRGRGHRRLAGRADAADPGQGTHLLVPAPRWIAGDHDHAGRRARDPARQGRPVRRRAPAHGPAGRRCRGRGPACRGLRQPHRPDARHGPGAHPRLRPRPRLVHRQRRRHRRAARAARPRQARRDRGRRPAGREGGDRRGATVPGPLRRGARDPAPDRPANLPVPGRRAPRAPPLRRRRSRRPAPQPQIHPHRARKPSRRRPDDRGNHPPPVWRASRSPGGARSCPRPEHPVPEPDPRPVRGPGRGGPRRRSSTTRTPSSPRWASSSAAIPRPWPSCATPAPTSRASACASRAGCAGPSCRHPPRASSSSTHATRSGASVSAATRPCSPRPTARRSSATWTAGAGTGRSRTSATS